MEEHKIGLYKKISLVFLVIILSMASLVTFVTYLHKDMTSADPLVFWTVENHLIITISLIFISIALGYGVSTATYNELRKSKKASKNLLEVFFLFLNKDEREILNYLVKSNKTVNQADISRLPDMNRVKAFRSLQKMKENNLIDVSAHGKIRKISLKDNVFEMLVNPES